MRRTVFLIVWVALLTGVALAGEKQPISFDDFISLGRVTDPQVSPDGKTVAYVVTYYSKAQNTSNSDVYLISIDGGVPRQLTTSPEADYNPRWSPDGKSIAFISGRGGEEQIWTIPADGGEAIQLSRISTGASGVIWSPDGKYLAFASDVYPDCPDDDCNRKRNEERAASKVKARLITHLFYRFWNHWLDDQRSHVFIIPASSVPARSGPAQDVTPGDYDCPPLDLGSDQDYVFSPDGKEICFVRNTDPVVATSTNNDLFVVPVAGGEIKRITENRANDNSPRYSPDGRYIAYRAMARPGYEADRYQLMLYDRHSGQVVSLTKDFDRSVGDIVWAPDGSRIYFTAEDQGYAAIFTVGIKGGEVRNLTGKSYNSNLRITPDGKTLMFARQAIHHPLDLWRMDADGKNERPITAVNAALLAQLEMNPAEEFWFEGAEDEKVHGFLLKPSQFDPQKKYPMVYLIHGGPQSMWADNFHYRWNAEMFAAPGYVVAMVNFHGSSGYGQEFTDAISGDWGGAPFEDLMKGCDYLLEKHSFIDDERVVAAGGSYGGYMVNWIAGHTDRFKCLVSHASLFNLVSFYGATEELWFPEWDFRGTPWTNPKMYAKWSPSSYVQNFKTPMLVIHSENDFRTPVTQGFELFTALQRMGVPSKLLYFPDEDHFVTKPQNAELWWRTVHEWLAQYLK